ncbi:hypothetical protein [Candidatus Sororendozoicomonas aggregata]|uniref:hypothetical protein n=1 Tax=Candidatus Sororendozoicomonas aggregata TaxID=3073239 RepID=UPI002ECFEBB0
MRLLIAFDFDDTLVCMKNNKNVTAGSRQDRESLLTHCQKMHKSEEPIIIQATLKSGSIKTIQYPLARGMMKNFVFALNDNPHVIGRSVFVVVITNGSYMPVAIRRFFMEAYGASEDVAIGIRVVSRCCHHDRDLRYNINRATALETFCRFLNSSRHRPRLYENTATDLWSFITPQMVYLFDDLTHNLLGAKEKGFNAINSREPAFFNHLNLLVNIIRSERFLGGIHNTSYDQIKTLETDGWAVV